MSESENLPPNSDLPGDQKAATFFDISAVPQLRAAIVAMREERRRWILAMVYLLETVCFGIGWWRGLPIWWGVAAVLVARYGNGLVDRRTSAWCPNPRDLAGAIERFDESLSGRLKAAVEQVGHDGRFNYMQQRLFGEIENMADTGAWQGCVPVWRRYLSQFFSVCTRAASIVCFLGWLWVPLAPSKTGDAMNIAATPTPKVEVTPGNAEIEKGTRFTVSARFGEMAPGVVLCFKASDGAESRVPMHESVGEPLYGASIDALERDLEYWVETASEKSPRYKVRVFEFPKLVDATATVRYPEGNEPREKTFEDARKLTVPEGSDVSWVLRFNKPIKAASVRGKDNTPQPLSLGAQKDGCVWIHSDLHGSLDVKLEMEDAEGRFAREQPTFQIEVIPNQPPKLRPLLPRNDARFTAIEEVDFEAEVWDDTGLRRWGVTLQLGKNEPTEFVLGDGAKAGQKIKMRKHEALERLDLKVGDSISWFFWAEDGFGKDGVRRIESDLLLGRVRAFEEQYRQSEGEEGEGEAGKGGPQLLEIQKQVIAATWNLRRKSAGVAKLDDEGKKGVETVRASEVKVQQMAEEAAGNEEDPLKQAAYAEALEHIGKAVEALSKVDASREQLEAAIHEERAAYDSLTRLAPSSYNMVRSKKSAPGEGQEQTRQMSQLEFAKEEDRYQSKSEAKSEKENKERKEMEDLLTQLRALARRQEEIAERMRELEARVNTSTDKNEKEAAQRELKRLSDEQKALARELEDAQQKTAAKNETLSEQREQLEAAREAAQKAAAAMEKGAMDEARAASARVSEKLRSGSESLRQQLSGKTREAARELQEKAQELQEQEKKVAEALSAPKKSPSKLVAEDVRSQAAGQQERLKSLQNEIQRVAEATESSEPIFSKALQDAHRSTLQNQTEAKLRVIGEALSMRQVEVARRAEKSAAKDVDELAKALEAASNDVLGDDVESLRQARSALDEIARTLGGAKPGDKLAAQGATQSAQQEGAASQSEKAGEKGEEGKGGKGDDTAKAGGAAKSGEGAGNGAKGEAGKDGKGAETAKGGGDAKSGEDAGIGAKGEAGKGGKGDETAKSGGDAKSGEGAGSGAKGEAGKDGKGAETAKGGGDAKSGEGAGSGAKGEAGKDGKGAETAKGGGDAKSGEGAGSGGKGEAGKGGKGAETANAGGGTQLGGGAELGRIGGSVAGGGNGVPAQEIGQLLEKLDRVEALLEKPQLRAGVARVQQVADDLRSDMKRNATKPSRNEVEQKLLAPLAQLRDAISSELARREGRESDVPVDRDPVPRKYEASVRRYYEALGGGR